MITVFGSINLDLIVAVDALPRPGETVLGPEYRMLAAARGPTRRWPRRAPVPASG